MAGKRPRAASQPSHNTNRGELRSSEESEKRGLPAVSSEVAYNFIRSGAPAAHDVSDTGMTHGYTSRYFREEF